MKIDEPLGWEEWEKISPGKRRQTAFHEAGHAAVHWLFADEGFQFVSMGDDGRVFGFVRHVGFGHSPEHIAAIAETWRAGGLSRAAHTIMLNLAGPCVQNIHERSIGKDSGYGEDWLDELIDEHFGDEGTDIANAIAAAAAVYPTERRQFGFLRRVAGWTDEAFSDPRVWSAVASLAARLEVADLVEADEAFDLMAAGWGEDAPGMPILALGRKWRRRFLPKPPEVVEMS